MAEENNNLSFSSKLGVFLIMLLFALWRSQGDLQRDAYLAGGDRTKEISMRGKACLEMFKNNNIQELGTTLQGVRDSFSQWRNSKVINLLSAYFDEMDTSQYFSIYLSNYSYSIIKQPCDEFDLIPVENAVFDHYIGSIMPNADKKVLGSQVTNIYKNIVDHIKQDSLGAKRALWNHFYHFQDPMLLLLLSCSNILEQQTATISTDEMKTVENCLQLADTFLTRKSLYVNIKELPKRSVVMSEEDCPVSTEFLKNRANLLTCLIFFNKFEYFSKSGESNLARINMFSCDTSLNNIEGFYSTKKRFLGEFSDFYLGLDSIPKGLYFLDKEITFSETREEKIHLQEKYLDVLQRSIFKQYPNAKQHLTSIAQNAGQAPILQVENDQVKLENTRLSYRNYLILGVSMIVIVLIILFMTLYFNYRENKKLDSINQQLRIINEELSEKNITLSALKRELSHRVKNNLLAIGSRIQSQIRKLRKSGDLDTAFQFMEINSRIQAIQLLHTQLQNSENTNEIGLYRYLLDLATYLRQSGGYSPGQFRIDFRLPESWTIPVGLASRFGLAVTELALNAFKYANVPDKEFELMAWMNEKQLFFSVADNGPGMPKNYKPGSGLRIVHTIIESQMKGSCQLVPSTQGTKWLLRIPLHRWNQMDAVENEL